MEVTVHIPDAIGERLGNDPEAIPRWLLEKAGLEAYRSREISGCELRLMLGLKSRLELDAFLTLVPGLRVEQDAQTTLPLPISA
jgi:hypothetical protein